jgi:hypothetical protein
LSAEQQDDIVKLLSDYCEGTLLTMNKVMMLKEAVNGFKVVTNPSVLSTEILGDLLWWFHKYGKNGDGLKSINDLKLSQGSILQKLKFVDQKTKECSLAGEPMSLNGSSSTVRSLICKDGSKSMVSSISSKSSILTAMDHLGAIGGLESFPLVELLNRMGVGLQIYNEHTKEMESWLLGIAPDFPKGKRELRFDWWPDHEIRRYFRLPDTRACFIPGYFLRVFVNMVNNKGYELREGYGNAAKMSKTFRYPPGVARCEVQIILCQMSDKDQDAFIVSVAGKGEQAMKNAFRELNVLRSFIYADSWGLNFHEFCLPLWHVDDQKRLSRVREDFLDEKKALDEVEPYIFGIPQMMERDSFDRSEASASSVHEDCTAVRSEWIRWYFGYKPDMEEVVKWKSLSNEEKFREGILKLRGGAQYEPTIVELEQRKYTSLASCAAEEDDVCNEDLRLYFADIYQRYAESCYDRDVVSVAESADSLQNMCFAMEQIVSFHTSDEVTVRERFYRCLKIFYREYFRREHFLASNVMLRNSVTVRKFEECLLINKQEAVIAEPHIVIPISGEDRAIMQMQKYCSNLLRDIHQFCIVECATLRWREACKQRAIKMVSYISK